MVSYSLIETYNDDPCFLVHRENSDEDLTLYVYIELSDVFVILNSDGLIENGSVAHSSCCVRCDRHESNTSTKLENFTSICCINGIDGIENPEDQLKYIQKKQNTGSFIDNKYINLVTLDICDYCHEKLLETWTKFVQNNSTKIVSETL